MWPKSIYLNLIFQISALVLIIKILIIDNPDLEKLSFIFSFNAMLLLIFFMLCKLIITLLFYFILNVITSKKNSYTDVTSIYLQGGIVNQLLPGLGLIFRFYKFKNTSNINLAQFSISQTFWSLGAFSSYTFTGLILGLIIFSMNILNTLFIIALCFALILIIFFTRKRIYKYAEKKLLFFSKLNKFVEDLKGIKNILKKKFYIFIFIFFGFISLTCLESLGFYICMIIYEADVSLFDASAIWIGSTLVQILSVVNFFGLFELILSTASSLLLLNFTEMFILALGFRILNTSSTLFVITIFYFIKFFQNLDIKSNDS